MGDELDYMSDDFITNCLKNENDVRPGLLKSHKEQREHNLMKKRKLESENKKKPREVLEAEVLEESLKKPINSTNKGFSMLEKMGFKSGMGLGKNNTGIVEPIGINIKNDKGGLGHKKVLKRSKPEKAESKLDKISESDYRAFLSKKNREREIASDLRRSQRICKELDEKCGENSPEEKWFWPKEESVESEEEEDEDEEELDISDAEKLELLTKFLREKYFYCIWCKIQYNDEKDLKDCPGSTRDDH